GLRSHSDYFAVLKTYAVPIKDLQVRLWHQGFHAGLERHQFDARAFDRGVDPLQLALDVAAALIALNGAQKSADHMCDTLRKPRCSRESHQAGPAHLGRGFDSGFAADLLVVLELAVRLNHSAPIFLAFLLPGRERFAQPKVPENLSDLACRSTQERDLGARKLAARERLRDQHAKWFLASLLQRDPQKGVITLFARFGEIFVAWMADRVRDRYRFILLDDQSHQSLGGAHRNSPDRVPIESHRRTQHQTFALRVKQVERTNLCLHPVRDRCDDLVQSLT